MPRFPLLPLVAVTVSLAAAPLPADEIDFGDDASQWALDGACDDPRFAGRGMDLFPVPSDIGHDASDCRALWEAGEIRLKNTARPADPAACDGIDFGDDGSIWANDGECDDPRFAGPAMHMILLDGDRGHDASDCRALCERGLIYPANGTALEGTDAPERDAPAPPEAPAVTPGRSRLGRG